MSAFGVGPGCVRACGELPDFALLVDPPINNSVKFAVAANEGGNRTFVADARFQCVSGEN